MDNVTPIRIIAGVLTLFVFLPLILIPYWKIFSKAGFCRCTLASNVGAVG
jgi:hypothetical protein